jgi:hypothetical protein
VHVRYRISDRRVLNFCSDQRFARRLGIACSKFGFTISEASHAAAPALTKLAAVTQNANRIGRVIMASYLCVGLIFVSTMMRIFCAIDGVNRRAKITHFCVY